MINPKEAIQNLMGPNGKDKFKGNKKLANVDTLSIPNLDMDLFREYREIIGKPFKTKDGDSAEIEKAM